MFNFFKVLFSPVIAVLDFVTRYFKTVVFFTIVYFISGSFEENRLIEDKLNQANLQQIELFGPIMDINNVLEDIEDAKNNENIKGILFVVNSPGGAVAPSIELTYAIKELAKIKPVIAYASGTMASGSYYASIYANKIYANPGSMIGSIGVIFQGANVEELMQKIGIKTQTIKIGSYKEVGTTTRAWNNYEKGELEKVINDTYDIFISDVAKARGLKKENHKEFADAHIFTSRQAKKVGLIDEVATISVAKKYLYKVAKIDKPLWKQKDKFDVYLDKILKETITTFSLNFQGGLKAY